MIKRQGTDKKAEILQQVALLLKKRLSGESVPLVEDFLHQYYMDTAIEDLLERGVECLYGAAMAHWSFTRIRRGDETKVRVYNPRFEHHGWESAHTIVEIVHDNMPFLVDSLRMALNERGLTVHLVIHPVIGVSRDRRGRLNKLFDLEHTKDQASAEALIHCEIDRQTGDAVFDGIRANIEHVLKDVQTAVQDWALMREQLGTILEELDQHPPPISAAELSEAKAFLQWLTDHHFTFLGYREYKLLREKGQDVLRSVADSGLGLLRDDGSEGVSESFAMLSSKKRKLARQPKLLITTKANTRSTVHRPARMDYIGIKRINSAGKVIGERRFLGLYTAAAYNRQPRTIPLLRKKVDNIIAKAGYPSQSHAGKALANIVDNLPRDELFQVSVENLFAAAMGILRLQERQRIRVFIHREAYERYYFCQVFIPREKFNTELRELIGDILEDALQGESSEVTVNLTDESVLARAHYVILTSPGRAPVHKVEEIEQKIVEAAHLWKDALRGALLESFGEEKGVRFYNRYGTAFRAGYQDACSAQVAVYDVERLETLSDTKVLAMNLYQPVDASVDTLRFRLYREKVPIPLSDVLPMLENMGLNVVDETPYRVSPVGVGPFWIHDFGMEHSIEQLDLDQVRGNFQNAFARIWRGEVENDGLNRLVLGAGLSWREIVVLRGYCKYLRQIGITFSQAYIEQVLNANPNIVQQLVQLFYLRFDSGKSKTRSDHYQQQVAGIEQALETVESLDQDRILRSFLSLVQATLRTNYFQRSADASFKSYLAFKFDSAQVPDLPDPRPMVEVFVYSPRFEGVHLRGGKVARGGIRWSNRMEDFRTEILGLLKAQMVKNAVIVPMGAKGGFVCKTPADSGDRDAVMAEGIACYQDFIRGLLDISDNLKQAKVVVPPDVVRHDDDDPYLVVAADKGTATFSDIANAVAQEYGFWLDDAFASGGSDGYDHKKMGITARGAWESVKRHFHGLGRDTQSDDFSVVGIGDMLGDVFGNGMLLSRHIKLVGAFNHQHIFIDPDPDPESSYKERKRLFQLPNSSWADYDGKAISNGGGVFARSAKSIALSAEVCQLLAIDKKKLAPNDLIRALLKAPVDLLWNGGIGTYIKASGESNVEVGDRANDSVRIDAMEMRCLVVGEGGNLGITQRGRIEFALAGGRIYTDAIDNSGGVDCSDHEVNIKILLNAVTVAGDMTDKQRRKLLADMTDDVADLVLANNYLQAQILSREEAIAPRWLDVHARMIRRLERDGRLNRRLEYLPNDDEIGERKSAHKGLCRPELAVLLAYVKISLVDDFMSSNTTGDPIIERSLALYFPKQIAERFTARMRGHRLWREIICTQLANAIVNRVGISFMFLMEEHTGASQVDIAHAYIAAREVFDIERLWIEVDALDRRLPMAVQLEMFKHVHKLISRATRWLLINRPRPLNISAVIDQLSAGTTVLAENLERVSVEQDLISRRTAAAAYIECGVPEALSQRIVGLDVFYSALDIVEAAELSATSVTLVAEVYFALSERLGLSWIREQILALAQEGRWNILARMALRDELYSQRRILTVAALQSGADTAGANAIVQIWLEQNQDRVQPYLQFLAELRTGEALDYAMLSVAMQSIRRLTPVDSSVFASRKRKSLVAKRGAL